jgi:hypothetical protein
LSTTTLLLDDITVARASVANRHRSRSEADGDPVVGIHHGDRERKVDEMLLTENADAAVKRAIRNAALPEPSEFFRPRKCRPLLLAEDAACFVPQVNRCDMVRFLLVLLNH